MLTNAITNLFTFTFEQGQHLFRATDNQSIDIKDIPLWFGEEEKVAKKYPRNYIFEFTTKRDLRLLNISHPLFHQDFMNKLLIMYRDFEARFDGTRLIIPDDVLHALLPIGLFGLESQVEFLQNQRVDLSHLNYNSVWNKSFEKYVDACFGGKHRYSIYERDLRMVNVMKWLYREYDGYIIPMMWPSKLLDGLFNREICLFRGYDSLSPIKFIVQERKAGKRKKQTGGNPKPPKTAMESSFDNETISKESNDKFVRETCINVGYMLKPPVNPATGWLELPSVEEIERYKQKREQDRIDSDSRWQPIPPGHFNRIT
jgi:hypothetical protein